MSETELRAKIADEIGKSLVDAMENCVCLGRDAYGAYIQKMAVMIQNQIKNPKLK